MHAVVPMPILRQEDNLKTVEFEYDLGQAVRIKAIDMIGRVDSLSLDNNGHTYRVVYWNDGARCQAWMYDWELEASQ